MSNVFNVYIFVLWKTVCLKKFRVLFLTPLRTPPCPYRDTPQLFYATWFFRWRPARFLFLHSGLPAQFPPAAVFQRTL